MSDISYANTVDGDALSELVERLVGRLPERRGALLPLLHAVQDELGYVPDEVVPCLASALNLSRAEVHGVVTFYHDYRRKPAGKHVVKICRAEACQARGGTKIEQAAEVVLGTTMNSSRKDGLVTLEPVYCLGLCAIGPNALVDGQPLARLDEAGLVRIAAAFGL